MTIHENYDKFVIVQCDAPLEEEDYQGPRCQSTFEVRSARHLRTDETHMDMLYRKRAQANGWSYMRHYSSGFGYSHYFECELHSALYPY